MVMLLVSLRKHLTSADHKVLKHKVRDGKEVSQGAHNNTLLTRWLKQGKFIVCPSYKLEARAAGIRKLHFVRALKKDLFLLLLLMGCS